MFKNQFRLRVYGLCMMIAVSGSVPVTARAGENACDSRPEMALALGGVGGLVGAGIVAGAYTKMKNGPAAVVVMAGGTGLALGSILMMASGEAADNERASASCSPASSDPRVVSQEGVGKASLAVTERAPAVASEGHAVSGSFE